MNLTTIVIEDALINEVTNQRRLYSKAIIDGDHQKADIHMKEIEKLKAKIKDLKEENEMMTREDKLWSMRGTELIKVADKLGVKVSCNRPRTALKEAKEKVIERILAKEAELAAEETEEKEIEEKVVEEEQPELPLENVEEIEQPKPKRGALIEWNGKSQNICKWGEELGISPNTLYGRIYKMNWSVERAFTTPSRRK